MMKGAVSFEGRIARRLGLPADSPIFAFAWRYVGGEEEERAWADADRDRDRKREIEDQVVEACKEFLAANANANAAEGEQLRARNPRESGGTLTLDWPFYAELSEAENERARGLAVYYAALAREEDYVVRFREEILGGETLRPDAAKEWVTSVAVQCVPPDAYATLRRLQSPPGHPEVEITGMEKGAGEFERVVKLRDRGTGETLTSRLSLPDGLAIHNVTLGEEQIEVYQGTTLDCLRLYGERLAKQYGWDRERAMWFILTDIAPPVHPLSTSIGFSLLGGPGHPWAAKRQEVTITIDPWVSEETLLDTYRRLRHDLRGKQGRMSLKTLTLFRFITERDGLKPQVKARRCDAVPWTARMKEWNKSHPDWLYKDHANFRAAYRSGAGTVIGRATVPKGYTDRLDAMANEQKRRRDDSHGDSQED